MVDQAEDLKRMMAEDTKQNSQGGKKTRIITISSGKGGVGKTNIAVNMGIAYAQLGKKVIVMDADLGLANVNVCLGIIPKYNLYQLIKKQKTMKKIFRKPFRYILSILTKAVIAKHKPTVIAVMGDGQTSIAREIIYEVIATTYPARRNLESPESEFSVPLTILGYPKYPKTLLDWLKMIGKTTVQFFKVKPYHHFLVLELNSIDLNILKYWLDITTSDVALIVGNTPINYSNYNFKKIIKVSAKDLDDILGPFKIAARQIAKFYNIKSMNRTSRSLAVYFAFRNNN